MINWSNNCNFITFIFGTWDNDCFGIFPLGKNKYTTLKLLQMDVFWLLNFLLL